MPKIAYHATDHIYDSVDYELLIKNRKNHLNGVLGLWCGMKNDWIKGFGKYIYEVHYSGKSYDMSINELAGYAHRNIDEGQYREIREKLLSEGYDYISIIEKNNECDMIVVLNFDSIEIKLVPS